MESQLQSKTSAFTAFFKSSYIFEDKEKKQKSLLLKELVSEVDALISDRDEYALASVIKKGYNLSLNQCMSFMALGVRGHTLDENQTVIRENIIKIYDTEIHQKLLSDMQKIDTSLQSGWARVSKSNDVKKFWNTYKSIDNYFSPDSEKIMYSNDKFFIEIFNSFKNIKKSLDNELKKPCSGNSKEISLATHTLNYLRSDLSYKIHYLKNIKKDVIELNFDEKLEKYNILFEEFSNIKHSISEDVLNAINSFDEKKLPQNIKDVIFDLKSIHKEITPHKLSVEKKLEVNNLYQKRFPQVLEEYILISPRYREKLTSHDESPDKLLLESLVEIKTKINTVFEDLQETNHKKLKVSNKYLKSL